MVPSLAAAATAGNAECRANVNATQFDQLSSLDSAAAAVQPLPGPLAGEHSV